MTTPHRPGTLRDPGRCSTKAEKGGPAARRVRPSTKNVCRYCREILRARRPPPTKTAPSNPALSVTEGHEIAREVEHRLLHDLPHLSIAVVHVDPAKESGERHHHAKERSHDGLPVHSHQ